MSISRSNQNRNSEIESVTFLPPLQPVSLFVAVGGPGLGTRAVAVNFLQLPGRMSKTALGYAVIGNHISLLIMSSLRQFNSM